MAIKNLIYLLVILSLAQGCSNQFTRSTRANISKTEVWAPLLGAVALTAIGKDQELSDWAREEAPVFGSEQSAGDASNNLVSALQVSALVSALFLPNTTTPDGLVRTNIEMVVIESVGTHINMAMTNALKEGIHRDRPNHVDRRSLPSGHTTSAFTSANFANGNIDMLGVNENALVASRWLINSAAIATAWARVEAGWHYPTDVLASAALANYMTNVFRDLYMDDQGLLSMYFMMMPDNYNVIMTYRFD